MAGKKKKVALIVGGSIGAELVPQVQELLDKAGAQIDWQRVDVGPAGDIDGDALSELLDEAVTNHAGLRRCTQNSTDRSGTARAGDRQQLPPAPRTRNVHFRQRLGLYAGVQANPHHAGATDPLSRPRYSC